jgi:hypothetical protein
MLNMRNNTRHKVTIEQIQKHYGLLCTCIWLAKFWNWLLEKSCPYYLIINFVGKNCQLLVVGMMFFFSIFVIIKKRDYSQTYLLIDTFNTFDNYYCVLIIEDSLHNTISY